MQVPPIPDPPPGPPPAPPTLPGEIGARRTSWPTALGVIGIILGSLGVLNGVCGGIGAAVQGMFTFGGDETMELALQAQRRLMPWAVGAQAVSGLAALLLLFASIDLARRRRRSRQLLLVWALVNLVVALGAGLIAVLMQQAMFSAMASASGGGPAPPKAFMGIMGAFSIVFILLWGWGPSIFTLIWFMRGRIKDEVAGWR
jgi:hypothetical protein